MSYGYIERREIVRKWDKVYQLDWVNMIQTCKAKKIEFGYCELQVSKMMKEIK